MENKNLYFGNKGFKYNKLPPFYQRIISNVLFIMKSSNVSANRNIYNILKKCIKLYKKTFNSDKIKIKNIKYTEDAINQKVLDYIILNNKYHIKNNQNEMKDSDKYAIQSSLYQLSFLDDNTFLEIDDINTLTKVINEEEKLLNEMLGDKAE